MPALTSVLGNSQRLDGGAMFGNAPKAMWAKWIEPDEQNRIPLACRCLLVEEDSGRRVLFETGIGAFFPPKLKQRFGVVESEHLLLQSLGRHGVSPSDIDVIVLSHLHFDHAGGLLSEFNETAAPHLVFDNATIVTSKKAWQRAQSPHPRDRASYIPELQALLETSDRLELIEGDSSAVLGQGYRFHYSDGHTPGLVLAEIAMPDGPVVFAADLIPGTSWVHLPITMGYDRFPEKLIDEKTELLTDLHARAGRLFYTHDPLVALSGIGRDERGRFVAKDPLSELVGVSS